MQKNVLKKLFISHRFDFALGAALLVVALCLFLVVGKLEKTGGTVTVKMNDDVIGVYSLSVDGEYPITSFYGSNTLVIKDGKAWVKDSSCPDHICENTGKISKLGETIICLPNTVFITITEGGASDLDAVVN